MTSSTPHFRVLTSSPLSKLLHAFSQDCDFGTVAKLVCGDEAKTYEKLLVPPLSLHSSADDKIRRGANVKESSEGGFLVTQTDCVTTSFSSNEEFYWSKVDWQSREPISIAFVDFIAGNSTGAIPEGASSIDGASSNLSMFSKICLGDGESRDNGQPCGLRNLASSSTTELEFLVPETFIISLSTSGMDNSVTTDGARTRIPLFDHKITVSPSGNDELKSDMDRVMTIVNAAVTRALETLQRETSFPAADACACLDYVVVDIEATISGKRVVLAYFLANVEPMMASHSLSLRRGLFHLAIASNSGHVFLDVPNLSQGCATSADTVTTAIISLELITATSFIDCFVDLEDPRLGTDTGSLTFTPLDIVEKKLDQHIAERTQEWEEQKDLILMNVELGLGGVEWSVELLDQYVSLLRVLLSHMVGWFKPWNAYASHNQSHSVTAISAGDLSPSFHLSPIALAHSSAKSDGGGALQNTTLEGHLLALSPLWSSPTAFGDAHRKEEVNKSLSSPPWSPGMPLQHKNVEATDDEDREHAASPDSVDLSPLIRRRSVSTRPQSNAQPSIVFNDSFSPMAGKQAVFSDDSISQFMNVSAKIPADAASQTDECATTETRAQQQALVEELALLRATAAVAERQEKARVAAHEQQIKKLSEELDAERRQRKRLQAELQSFVTATQNSLLQIPQSTRYDTPLESETSPLIGIRTESGDADFSNQSLHLSPSSPSSPSELRAARRLRQSKFNASTPKIPMSDSISQWNDSAQSSGGARTPSVPPSGRGSFAVALSAESVSKGLTSIGEVNSAFTRARLLQAQAQRRLMIEAMESREGFELVSNWALTVTLSSQQFVKKTLKRFHESIDTALKAHHQQTMLLLSDRDQCIKSSLDAAVREMSHTISLQSTKALATTPRLGAVIATPVRDKEGGTFQPPLAPSEMSDASPPPMQPIDLGSFSATSSSVFLQTPTTRGGKDGRGESGRMRSNSALRCHRIQVSSPGMPMLKIKSEVVQALITAGRNLAGEKRKALGEKVPNLKFDQVRAEAVHWKQTQLDEYKAFCAPQVMFFGDGHTGKSSVIACLSGKAPMLFKKSPTVVTPTIEIQRTRTTVALNRSSGSWAVVPLGGFGPLSMFDVARIVKESSSGKEPASLAGSSSVGAGASSSSSPPCPLPIVLTEIPPSTLRAASAYSLPTKGTIFAIVFRLSDGESAGRASILRYVQHILAMTASSLATDEQHQYPDSYYVSVPIVLVATHVDQTSGFNNDDLTPVQQTLGSFRTWLEEELRQFGHQFVRPIVLDTFAVSCALWMVSGERPGSADSFPSLLLDWASYLSLTAPTAPEHFLPSIGEVMAAVASEGPFSDDDDDDENNNNNNDIGEPLFENNRGSSRSFDDTTMMHATAVAQRGGKTRECAPMMVDYFWARRGGGSQGGGLFASSNGQQQRLGGSLWSSSSSASVANTAALKKLTAKDVAQRWLHSSAMGMITLFTALARFMEFTGCILSAAMFDNIVFQHLEMISRADEETKLSRRLLCVRDVIVERFLAECKSRGILTRVQVDTLGSDVIILGRQWLQNFTSWLMMPYTIQISSALPLSTPLVRQQFANVGSRHVVSLLQRIQSEGLDLTTPSMTSELSALRFGHASRKLLFHMLPPPLNALATTQRNAETLFSALQLVHDMNKHHTVSTSPPGASEERTTDDHSLVVPSSVLSSSSLFLPCASSPFPVHGVAFVDEVVHILADVVFGATIQVDMPFPSLFSKVQSNVFQCCAATYGNKVTQASREDFCGLSSTNFFAATISNGFWLLLSPITSSSEIDGVFSEYRVVVAVASSDAVCDEKSANSSTAAIDDSTKKIPEDHSTCTQLAKKHVDDVLAAFCEEMACCVMDNKARNYPHVTSMDSDGIWKVQLTSSPQAEDRFVQSWDETNTKLQHVMRELNVTPSAENGEELLRMIERTQRPSLRRLLEIMGCKV